MQRRLAGKNPHGEADYIEQLVGRLMQDIGRPIRLLDGGCGTGRVGIELARRGFQTVGVDADPAMLEQARRKAPDLPWVLADLALVRLPTPVDVAVLAGNVMIFTGHGHEGPVLTNIAHLLAPGGFLVAGFQLQPGGLSLAEYDALAAVAGLSLQERWETWEMAPWDASSSYAVSCHASRA